MKRNMGKLLAVALMTGSVMTTSQSYAAARVAPTMSHNLTVYFSEPSAMSHANCYVKNGTVYDPIWYVGRLWGNVGGGSRWDGMKKAWFLQPSTGPGLPPPPDLLLDERTGTSAIYVNSTLVGEHIPIIVQPDPYSNQSTVYMPLLTVVEVLETSFHWHTTELSDSGDTYTWRISSTG